MIADFIRRVVPARFRPIGYLTNLVRQRTNDSVRLGPFAGMRYIEQAIGSAYLPKLLGTYERELSHVIESVCARGPGLIVDVGAAEGYYAVGLALRNPTARVVAFERDVAGRRALLRMAELNDAHDRIQVLGECKPADLQNTLAEDTRRPSRTSVQTPFVLCDVEGNEEFLLDPRIVPGLRRASILVETHDFLNPGIIRKLQPRFSSTHHIHCLWQTSRTREDFPFTGMSAWLVPKSYFEWAVSEWRPERMCWLYMEPRE